MSSPVEDAANPFGHAFAMANIPQDLSQDSTAPATGTNNTGDVTPSDARPREKKRVGFSGSTSAVPSQSEPSSPISGASTPEPGRSGSIASLLLPPRDERSHLPQLAPGDAEQIKLALSNNSASRPRSAIRNLQQTVQPHVAIDSEDESDGQNREKAYRRQKAREALQRGKDLERDERIRSAPTSRQGSPKSKARWRVKPPMLKLDDVPIDRVSPELEKQASPQNGLEGSPRSYFRQQSGVDHRWEPPDTPGLRSGAVTPVEERAFYEEYKPPPKKYRGGVLSQLLRSFYVNDAEDSRLYNERQLAPDVSMSTQFYSFARGSVTDLPGTSTPTIPTYSPPESGTSTPRGRRSSWYATSRSQSTSSLSQLIGSSSSLGTPAVSGFGEEVSRRLREQKKAKRPHLKERVRSSGALNALSRHVRPKTEEELRIKKHISEILQRQHYLIKLCKGLMMYGAPSHRLEEYMKMSSRVLEIEAQFLYIPGAMLISFNDPTTHTTELKLVKVPQGLDLGRLRDVHEVYKEVIHDRIGASEANHQLNVIFERNPKHNRLFLIAVYGLASVCVGPFAFGARLIDLPIAFLLGTIVGILQLYIAPASELYNNVFEIAASVITSFLARAFGSLRGGELFCFSALAQSSIALILPGYMVLLASLELQSKSMVAGSVRMVYAIIYSLFLGYGITLGTAVYGLIDHNATSATTCSSQINKLWYFLFVPGFTMCLIIINQAKWKQAPMMLVISAVGYVVNYFSAQRFSGNTQISNMFGALAIGVMANGYSRLGSRVENAALDIWEQYLRGWYKRLHRRLFPKKTISPKKMEEGLKADDESIFTPQARRVGYSLAAAAMLPAVFVQVPSGIAVGGSLLTGLASADQITNSSNVNGTSISNVTSIETAASTLNTVSFNVGYSVVQVAIGITVGLFLSAIVVYPFGKKRSGLFSF